MARAAGLDRNPIGSLFPKRDPNRYPPLTPGLSPVYAAIETTNWLNSFNRRKAVQTASALLAFNTRLKPGVSERGRLHSAFDSR